MPILFFQELKFRIFETECRIFDTNTDPNFESKVSGLSFTSRCVISTLEGKDSVAFESQLDLGLIRIEPDKYQAYYIDQFSNYINVSVVSVNLK